MRSLAFSFVLLTVLPSWGGAVPEGGASEVSVEPDEALQEEVRRVAAKLGDQMGTRLAWVPGAFRADEVSRRALAAARSASLLETGKAAARGRAWSDLGLGAGASPASLIEHLAADLDGLSLDAARRRLLVDPDRLSDRDFGPAAPGDEATTLLLATGIRPDEPVAAHLLVHGLQAQKGLTLPEGSTTDALLAAAAWREGEANLAALLYLFAGMGLGRDVLERGLDPGEVLDGRLLPSWLPVLPAVEQSLLEFVYGEGFAQAAQAYREGGFPSVEKAARRRTTTSALLHPARPVTAELPATPSATPPPGYALADRDSLGEQGILTLVSVLTGKDNLAMLAAEGWVSDELCRFEREGGSNGEGITQWVSTWTTPEEAVDFLYAFERSLKARFPTRETEMIAEGGTRLAAGGRLFSWLREGTRVTVRVTSPDDRIPSPARPAPIKSQPPKKAAS